jgi:hypothetical protein
VLDDPLWNMEMPFELKALEICLDEVGPGKIWGSRGFRGRGSLVQCFVHRGRV